MSKEHLLDLVKATVNGDEQAAADAFHKYIIARAPTFVSEGMKDDESCDDEEENDEQDSDGSHVTAKRFMDVMRTVKWPGAKISTGMQPRNTATGKVISIKAQVTQDKDDAQQYIEKINDAIKKEFPDVTGNVRRETMHDGRGANLPDTYYWSIAVKLSGVASERLEFIKYAKELAKKMKSQGIPVELWTENKKSGAEVDVSLHYSAQKDKEKYPDVGAQFATALKQKFDSSRISVKAGSSTNTVITFV